MLWVSEGTEGGIYLILEEDAEVALGGPDFSGEWRNGQVKFPGASDGVFERMSGSW